MENNDQITLQDVFEIVTHIKDTAATQESVDARFVDMDKKIEGLRSELKGDIVGLRSELKGDIASLRSEMERGFEGLRAELRDIRAELEDIKRRLDELELRTRQDADASAEDYLELRKRVSWLETKVKELELARG